jgi:enamine deaminase RidA (YjgF/YER057c/UK114 family)
VIDRPRQRANGLVHEVLQPDGWPLPSGYVNGVAARGRMIFTGGLIGWDAAGRFPPDFAGQTRQTLANVLTVLSLGGAGPEHVVRMTWYVCDIEEYRSARKAVGAAYAELMGRNYPPMAVVEVTRLVEPLARLEIETTAVVPD